MASLETNIPISHVMSNITMTVHITGLTKWHFQAWIARQLIRLAALILNMNIDFENKVRTK